MRFLALLLVLATPAFAHEPYSNFYKNPQAPPQERIWCCNGDLEGAKPGDCSAAAYRRVQGGVIFYPKRYPGAAIFVPNEEVIDGGPPNPDARAYEAHYCGVKRTPYSSPPSPRNPDPAYVTICASIYPPNT